MEALIVVAIIWIISEVWKESIQGTIYDKNANELREIHREIIKNQKNIKM